MSIKIEVFETTLGYSVRAEGAVDEVRMWCVAERQQGAKVEFTDGRDRFASNAKIEGAFPPSIGWAKYFTI